MNMMPLAETSSDASRSHLLIAAHFVYAGRVGGAEHMFYNLVQGVAQLGTPTTVLCGDIGRVCERFRATVDATPGLRFREVGGGGPRFIAEQRACLDRTLAADAILFPNYYLPPLVPRRLGRTGVVLHDLQYRHFPMYFSARKRAWLHAAQAFAVRRADRVFVISDYIRRDVLRVFGERIARKLIVAPNPISWTRFEPVEDDSPPLDRPYVLSVAAHYPHKNLTTLIRGFAKLAQLQPDVQLVLCGQDYASLHGVGGTGVALRPLIDALGLSSRVTLTGYLDDATLGRWYRHAALFAFPSLFEGFGMPPVEALGFGLPVLIAGRTALPEVTLGLARSVEDAENPSAWAAHMLSMLQEGRSARLTPLQASHVRQTYSPAVCAARYLGALL